MLAPPITAPLRAKALAEAVGTFFLVLTISLVITDPTPTGWGPIAIAAVLAAMIYALGHISRAHFNPAVTFAFVLMRDCTPREIAPYLAAQIAAAGAASFLALILQGSPEMPPRTFDLVPTLLAEFVFTFALVVVILHVALRQPGNQHYGITIAAVVLAGIVTVGPISAAAFNPAVLICFAVTDFANPSDLWPHLLAQLTAAITAVFAFEAMATER
ncbi:MAG: aquaporin [Phycisphaerales bacterium]